MVANWGFDFLSVTATRLMNKQFGYRMNDLRQFINTLESHPSHWINNRVAKYLFAHRHLDWLGLRNHWIGRKKQLSEQRVRHGSVLWCSSYWSFQSNLGNSPRLFSFGTCHDFLNFRGSILVRNLSRFSQFSRRGCCACRCRRGQLTCIQTKA